MAPHTSASIQPEERDLISSIVRNHIGREITKISNDTTARYKKVYMLDLKPGETTESGMPGCDRLPGDVTRAVLRLTNPDVMLNDAVVVQNEVASMMLAQHALSNAERPLVPRVYGWEPAGDDIGWILMEHMPGTTLEPDVFKKLDREGQQSILKDIAAMVKALQEYELPQSVKGYGGLQFDGDNVVVGATAIHGATRACDTYHELLRQYMQTQLRFMDRCDVVRGWRDTALRDRIDKFVAEGFEPLLAREIDERPRPTLIHASLDVGNLVFDRITCRVTGLLDFKFSHIASGADEYLYSFETIGGLVAPPFDGADSEGRHMLDRFADASAARRQVAMDREEAFAAAGVRQPVDVPSMESLSRIHWFLHSVSPGAFFLPGFRSVVGGAVLERMRGDFESLLRGMLEEWGY